MWSAFLQKSSFCTPPSDLKRLVNRFVKMRCLGRKLCTRGYFDCCYFSLLLWISNPTKTNKFYTISIFYSPTNQVFPPTWKTEKLQNFHPATTTTQTFRHQRAQWAQAERLQVGTATIMFLVVKSVVKFRNLWPDFKDFNRCSAGWVSVRISIQGTSTTNRSTRRTSVIQSSKVVSLNEKHGWILILWNWNK